MKRWAHAASWLAIVLSGAGQAAPSGDPEDRHDPAATQRVLTLLMEAADDPIARDSTCGGSYGPRGRARVKDLLSARLSYLYHGESIVSGHCRGAADGSCRLVINRRFEEDVSSATIDFDVRNGRLQPRSLRCLSTP